MKLVVARPSSDVLVLGAPIVHVHDPELQLARMRARVAASNLWLSDHIASLRAMVAYGAGQ